MGPSPASTPPQNGAYGLIVRLFDTVAAVIAFVGNGIRDGWRSFTKGPLEPVLFWAIIVLTGAGVLFKATLVALDRLASYLEKGFMSIALLAMVGLSFLDYLRREVSGFDLEIQGGPNMAVVLMVWVGFLGASLATRQGKHIAVDATDRLLSPAAARMAKRFSALVAAGFCWKFMGISAQLVEESLARGAGQDGLPLWGWLVEPVNVLGRTVLPVNPTPHLAWGAGAILLTMLAIRYRWPDDTQAHRLARRTIDTVATLALAVGLTSWMGLNWSPSGPDGERIQWTEISAAGEMDAVDATAMQELDKKLDDLIFEDTGAPTPSGEGKAPQRDTSVATLLAESSGGQKFPLWLAQAVLPLSFGLMALRFFGITLFRRFNIPPPPRSELVPKNTRAAKDLIVAGLIPGILLGLGAAIGMSTGKLILMGAVLLILVGAPLFLSIGIAALSCVVLIQGFSSYTVATDMYEAVKKEELLAIPFFVLAGNIMTQGSIADRLVGVARAFMGRMPGGLGLATIFACVVFAAISGSSPVTVIAVGSIMFPMLVKERYPENYSIGVLTSAGSLGIIIPPSVPMIVYAIMVSNQDQQVSPNDLFIAGVLPGLFIAAMLVLYTMYQTRPTKADVQLVLPELEGGYFPNLFREARKSALALLLPIIVLGGIYGVLGPIRFTVTEAAAVAVVYALFIELFVHRELKWRKLPTVLSDSGVMMGSLFLIIVLAIAFNKFLAEQMIPQQAAVWLAEHIASRWQFLILVNLFLLALGCVMDIISAILIVAPLLAPIALQYGLHPVHFGIIFIVNLELGYLTPPMGINLFVSSTVFNRSILQVIRSTFPFLLLMLFCLAIIAAFPALSLALL